MEKKTTFEDLMLELNSIKYEIEEELKQDSEEPHDLDPEEDFPEHWENENYDFEEWN